MSECNDMCLTGYDVGVPTNVIAYAHPMCPEHGIDQEKKVDSFKVGKTSSISGNFHEMEFPPELQDRIEAWCGDPRSASVQVAFPELDADHREFLMTGITPEEWAETMGEQ